MVRKFLPFIIISIGKGIGTSINNDTNICFSIGIVISIGIGISISIGIGIGIGEVVFFIYSISRPTLVFTA